VTGTPPFAAAPAGTTRVHDPMRPANWAPVTPAKWKLTGDQVILAEAGTRRPGPRRPFEYAVLTAGPVYASVDLHARVRLDEPVELTNRDVIIVFGYRSDTEFYYAHLSTDNTTFPAGRVGFGSFDNRGRLRDLRVTGTPAGQVAR
jgi:hypothetical protein